MSELTDTIAIPESISLLLVGEDDLSARRVMDVLARPEGIRFEVARVYTDRIRDLCERHGIELVLVEWPKFRAPRLSPSQERFYRSRGRLLLADHAAAQDPSHWFDLGHFNVDGATSFSRALAESLQARAGE